MQILWGNMTIRTRYVTGDQWGPLVKLYTDDYEIHLHMNPIGTVVTAVGAVKNLGSGIRLRADQYENDVAAKGGVPFPAYDRPAPPDLAQASALFDGSAFVNTTYHQWLRAETTGQVWTLGCDRPQEGRMRRKKPQYQP